MTNAEKNLIAVNAQLKLVNDLLADYEREWDAGVLAELEYNITESLLATQEYWQDKVQAQYHKQYLRQKAKGANKK